MRIEASTLALRSLVLAAALALFGCGDGEPPAASSVRTASVQPDSPYRLDAPDARFELPGVLDEISGLTVLDDRYLGAVQDEDGTLFVLDAATGEVVRTPEFGGGGDYEGVERVGERAVVLRSDGRLFVLDDWTAERSEARTVETGLHGSCDAEGLAFDAEATRLLIACKEQPGRGHRGTRTIYAFDPATNRLDPTPAFAIHRDSLASGDDGMDDAVRSFVQPALDLNTFKPSAVAVHPRTEEVYVLSSARTLLLVLDRAGSIGAAWPLSESRLRQPEGLAFAPDGTLFIASEADGATAVVLRFDYRP